MRLISKARGEQVISKATLVLSRWNHLHRAVDKYYSTTGCSWQLKFDVCIFLPQPGTFPSNLVAEQREPFREVVFG